MAGKGAGGPSGSCNMAPASAAMGKGLPPNPAFALPCVQLRCFVVLHKETLWGTKGIPGHSWPLGPKEIPAEAISMAQQQTPILQGSGCQLALPIPHLWELLVLG